MMARLLPFPRQSPPTSVAQLEALAAGLALLLLLSLLLG